MSSVCRLCLNTSSDNYRDCKSVDQKYFEVVLPEIDITMIKSSVLCSNCSELLRTSYLFKTNCLETERIIKSYIERVGGVDVSLTDVLKTESFTKVEDIKPEGFVKLETNNDTESYFNDFYDHNDDDTTDEKRYSCTICNLDFEDEGSLKRHNHLGSLRCGVCNKDFSNGYNLRRHMTSHKKTELDEQIKKIEEVNDETLNEMEESLRKHDEMYQNDFNLCVLTCEICRESFDTKQALLEHVKCHFGVKCELCGKFYKDLTTLDEHLNESHQVKVEKKVFSCDICLRSYTARKWLLSHIRTHFERPRCSVCNKTYYDVSSLKRHVVMMHKVKIKSGDDDKDNECDDYVDFEVEETNMIDALMNHLEKYSKNELFQALNSCFKCDVCGNSFKEKVDLHDHLRVHFCRPSCKLCNKAFLNQNCLKKHMIKIHNTELNIDSIKLECFNDQSFDQSFEPCSNCNNTDCNCNNLKCPTCGKVMGNKSSFIRHKLTHSKRKTFICDFCQKSFLTKLYLQRHINTTHLGVPRKRTSNNIFTCDTCGLTTNNKHTLIQHIRTHTGERPYKCDLCGKAFVQSSTLGTHKRTVHSTERLFTCEYCSKSFNTKGSLTKHILEVHMVDKIEKKFACNFCGKKYRLQSQLTCHLKWHSSERQFSCDICGKPFVDRHSVKKHRVIHFSEKQHKCEICGKGFHQKYNIKIHMKVHSRVP